MPPLLGALRAAGADVHVVDWDDDSVDWARFDLALLRSTWDASIRLAEFLAWSERVAKLTTLLNPLAVICWNTDKRDRETWRAPRADRADPVRRAWNGCGRSRE